MRHVILVPQPIADEGVAFLQAEGFDVRHGSGIDPATLIRELDGCSGVLVRTAVMSDVVMAAAPTLRVIAKHGAGVDNIDVEAATQRGIQVTNAPLGMTNAVAEYAVTMILALARKLIPCDKAYRATADFSLRSTFSLVELAGKTAGIVGMGRIGRATAKRLLAFDMGVVGYDPYLSDADWPDGIGRADSLWNLMPACHFLSLHLPLTETTRGLISEELLGRMRPDAYFINAARGEIVDEQALIRTLEKGRLAGAGIDVYAVEPPRPDHPFFHMDNVIVSPHNSALTPEAAIHMAVDAARGIAEVLRGMPITWPVNRLT